MEKTYRYLVVSKKNNLVKPVVATDKFNAVQKALSYFENHSSFDLQVLKSLTDAKKR